MDSIIYKISEAGVPQSVFAADTTTFDGKYDGTSVNGLWSSYSQIVALDSFDAEADMVAGGGECLQPQPPAQALFNHSLRLQPSTSLFRLLPRQPHLPDGRWYDENCRK